MSERPPAIPLGRVLQVNAVVSASSGVLALVLAGPLGRLLGVPAIATALVGAGLVVFAADVALASRASGDRLAAYSRLIGVADVAWVAGTAVLIAVGVFDAAGVVIMGAVALVVLAFATLELQGARAVDHHAFT